jgi:hypothetical protein
MNDTDLLFDFLKSRQLYCAKKLDIVNVTQLGGGRENYCLTTAIDKSNELGCGVVSGWLSYPLTFIGNNWQKQFTQHWWNYDRELSQHVDFSPAIEEEALYIADMDIMAHALTHINDLTSQVSSSIIYRNSDFYIIDYSENGYKTQAVNDLSNETIYSWHHKASMAAEN